MLDFLQQFAETHLYTHAVIITICAGAILLAMGVDLYFGLQKAKTLGKARTSTGYKKTCEKARKYFSPFLVLLCIDLIAACAWVPVPVFAMVWAAWCVYCEFTSVREKAWQKEELRKAEKTMNVIIENKEDIAKILAKLLTETPGTADSPDLSKIDEN